MKIIPQGAPTAAPAMPSNAPQSSRDVAVAKLQSLMQAQAQPAAAPVQNQNAISPEETINNPSASRANSSEPSRKDTNVESSSERAPEATAAAEEFPLSSQYAALARKEKALRAREQQIKAREAAMRAPAAPAEPARPTFDETKYVAKDSLKQDPFSILADLGLTYEQLTEMAMNAPRPEQVAVMQQIKTLQAELAALKGETESTKKTIADQSKQQYDQTLNQIRNETNRLVMTDPSYETIAATNSAGDVVELIQQTFEKDGYLMTIEEAAKEVEEYLVDELVRTTQKSKKVQSRLRPATADQSAQASQARPAQAELKTLTNQTSSTKPMTARERAIAVMEGRLK